MSAPLTLEGRVAARVRAVLAYAALSYDEVAQQTGIGEATLRRIASAKTPRGASLDELWLIAEACQLPRKWLTEDWHKDDEAEGAPPAPPLKRKPRFGEGTTQERVELLETYMSALLVAQERRHPELDASTRNGNGPERPKRRSRRARETSSSTSSES